MPTKIRLVKTRPSSDEADDKLWEENNFSNLPPHPQRRKEQSLFLEKKLGTKEGKQVQKWKGTDQQSQSELMKFYKDLQKNEREDKKRRRKNAESEVSKKWGQRDLHPWRRGEARERLER